MSKEKNNVITKFRALWESLSPLEKGRLWDIMTALRGSDGGLNDDVKYATTARIRGELLGQNYNRGYTFTEFKQAKDRITREIRLYKPHEVRKSYQRKPAHFRRHVRSAIYALNFLRPRSSMRDLQKFLFLRY